MSLVDKWATEHMRHENAFESEVVRVERAYIAGYLKAMEVCLKQGPSNALVAMRADAFGDAPGGSVAPKGEK